MTGNCHVRFLEGPGPADGPRPTRCPGNSVRMNFHKNSAPLFNRAIVFGGSAGLGQCDHCPVGVKLPNASHRCKGRLQP